MAAAQEKAEDKWPHLGLKYHVHIRQALWVKPCRCGIPGAIHWGNLPDGLVKPRAEFSLTSRLLPPGIWLEQNLCQLEIKTFAPQPFFFLVEYKYCLQDTFLFFPGPKFPLYFELAWITSQSISRNVFKTWWLQSGRFQLPVTCQCQNPKRSESMQGKRCLKSRWPSLIILSKDG